jgi:VWFA-related protein
VPPSSVFGSLATALTLLAVAVAPIQTEQEPPASAEQPTFRVAANYIRADVFVTKDGTPVADLTRDDFEVFEDGRPQTIDAFEYVKVMPGSRTPPLPQSAREGERLAADPRRRLFVVFLDIPHVEAGSDMQVRGPLSRFLTRVIGPGDLIGVMTPDMAARAIAIDERPADITSLFESQPFWGEKNSWSRRDPTERVIEACFTTDDPHRQLYWTMVRRWRAKRTQDALRDLISHLRSIREERTAIILVTEGWPIVRWDPALMTAGNARAGRPEVGVGPDGRLTSRGRADLGVTGYDCDALASLIANVDLDREFRDSLDEANWANASLYPVDPRGLAAFGDSIGPAPPLPPVASQQLLRTQLDLMRVMAANTDGQAVINSNDIESGLRRLAADLSSYYLLSYYSDGKVADGRFHEIKVRVRRPGVDIRSRRGYLAVKPPPAPTPTASSAPTVQPETAAALASIATAPPELPLALRAAVPLGRAPTKYLWLAGELGAKLRADTSLRGASVRIMVSDESGTTVGTSQAVVDESGFVAGISLDDAAGRQPLKVQARVTGGDGLPLSHAITVDPDDATAHALVFRQGPSTGPEYRGAARPVFVRADRVRVDVPIGDWNGDAAARVLDARGQPRPLPSAVTTHSDAQGARWARVELALAPLAAGSYLIELTAAEGARALVPIRVVP